MKFDREKYFDAVRGALFGGKLTQQQIDGQNGILAAWEKYVPQDSDLRWLAYMLATTKHETASEMWPIAEYGKGEGSSYGEVDPETGQAYYGRGFVQLTWRDNYARADLEMGWTGSKRCEYNADLQLTPEYAAPTMFKGMAQGWFRTSGGVPETLDRYFNEEVNDPYGAREIINGDKSKVPSWSNGVSIGNLIADYHEHFLDALRVSIIEEGESEAPKVVTVLVKVPTGVRVDVTVEEI